MSQTYRFGVRKSELAKRQSEFIFHHLEKQGLRCEWVELVSHGDTDRTQPLYEIETATPGLFTKELEIALLENRIDLAVHSLKDLPTTQPKELQVAAITARENTSDCIVIHPKNVAMRTPLGLKKGLTIGTSSLRREAQLLSQRPDLKIVPIRGNVPTRVQKVREGKVDGVVLARAGLNRLDLDLGELVMVDLPEEFFVPAPGQGALAIETRRAIQPELKRALDLLHDPKSADEVDLERRVLHEVEGGCTLPLGVRCRRDGNNYEIRAFLGCYEKENPGQRRWISFIHFGMSTADSFELVTKAVNHLRRFGINGQQ